MCGIFGFTSEAQFFPPIKTLIKCRDTLRHRGPDFGGAFEDERLFFGFRRLAILDLSSEGNQPRTTRNGRYTIVFNGEIYNYLELKEDLKRQGSVFHGNSDTEVLLELFALHGVKCLKMLNGMFAFAVYDKVDRTITLARDRLGVKPLYYWIYGSRFAFASEIKALKGLPEFSFDFNLEALAIYFRIGMVPEWTSVFPNVHKLPPGTFATYHINSCKLINPTRYWDLPLIEDPPRKTEGEWLDQIEDLLWDATRIRLRSDVPLGVFLSGGIDSGLVAAAAAKQQSALASLTIGFSGYPEDETALALSTAQFLGLNPLTSNIHSPGIQLLPDLMAHFDEPFADTSALPTSIVCAEARKQFTVVLSGDGGDEVFGGYRNHVRAWKWRHLDRIPSLIRRIASNSFSPLMPPDSRQKRFCKRLGQPVGRFGMGGMIYPFEDWIDQCLKDEFNIPSQRLVSMYDVQNRNWGKGSSIDVAQRTDLRNYMLEDILAKVDRMSMLHSIEVRSPFLDFRLVELGLSIPSALRVKNGQNKYLLRRLAERHLPIPVCKAPKKGFSIPIRSWLAPCDRTALFPYLASFPQSVNPFKIGGFERLVEMARKNPNLVSALIVVLAYHWWCERVRKS